MEQEQPLRSLPCLEVEVQVGAAQDAGNALDLARPHSDLCCSAPGWEQQSDTHAGSSSSAFGNFALLLHFPPPPTLLPCSQPAATAIKGTRPLKCYSHGASRPPYPYTLMHHLKHLEVGERWKSLRRRHDKSEGDVRPASDLVKISKTWVTRLKIQTTAKLELQFMQSQTELFLKVVVGSKKSCRSSHLSFVHKQVWYLIDIYFSLPHSHRKDQVLLNFLLFPIVFQVKGQKISKKTAGFISPMPSLLPANL